MWGFKPGFRVFIGACELIFAVLLATRYCVYAAYALSMIMVGAIIVTLDNGHSSTSAITCLLGLALLMMLRSDQLPGMNKRGRSSAPAPSHGVCAPLTEGKEG